MVGSSEFVIDRGHRAKVVLKFDGNYVYVVALADIELGDGLSCPFRKNRNFVDGVVAGESDIVEDVVGVIAYGYVVRNFSFGVNNFVRADFAEKVRLNILFRLGDNVPCAEFADKGGGDEGGLEVVAARLSSSFSTGTT